MKTQTRYRLLISTCVALLLVLGWWVHRHRDEKLKRTLVERGATYTSASTVADPGIPNHIEPTSRPLLDNTPFLTSNKKTVGEEMDVLKQITSDDDAVRARAVEDLRRKVVASPSHYAVSLKLFLKPLQEANLNKEILSLTEVAIPSQAADSSAISDFQQARVQSLLVLGDSRMLEEAKSAVNVAVQKTTSRALLLARAVIDASKLEGGASESIMARLRSVKTDDHRYDNAIPQYVGKDTYEAAMARGNLLLLSGRLDEAREAFREAIKIKDVKGKKLFAAVEGIIRVERAQTGDLLAGNSMLEAMGTGASDSPQLKVLADLNLPVQQLIDAGKSIQPARWPSEIPSEGRDASLQAHENATGASNADLRSRLDHPTSLLRSFAIVDRDLLQWTEQWRESSRCTSSDRDQLRQIVARSPLSPEELFTFGKAYQDAMSDAGSTVVLFNEAVSRIHSTLANSRDEQQSQKMSHLLETFRDAYLPVFWECEYDQAAFDAHQLYCQDYMQFAAKSDADMQKNKPLVGLSLANCYWGRRMVSQQLEVLHNLNIGSASPGMQAIVRYSESRALYEKGDYKSALPGFVDCARWQGLEWREEAASYVVRCHARLGNAAESKAAFDIYVATFKPGFADIAGLLCELEPTN